MSVSNSVGFRILLKASAAAAVLVAACAGQAVAAPDSESNERPIKLAAANLDEIIVTGTNIRGRATIGSTVIQVDRDDIERGGYIDAGQAIRSLPGNFGGGINPTTRDTGGNLDNSGNNRGFVASPNLLGLGPNATLTLLNGRRIPAAAEGIVPDISLIPGAAIERVDVLVDGASSIYGADAVAGVVNIITRRDMDGVEARVRYGGAEGGLATAGGSLFAGGTLGRLSGIVGVDYLDQDPLNSTKRSRSQNQYDPSNVVQQMERTSLFASGDFRLSGTVKLYGDFGYAERLMDISTATSTGFVNQQVRMFQYSSAAGAVAELGSAWTLDLGGSFSSNKSKSPISTTRRATGVVSTTQSTATSELTTFDARASGPLFQLPAGSIAASFGAGYRDENFVSLTNPKRSNSRDVTSIYGELNIPLLGTESGVPLVEDLRLSLAGRRDDYSDFGAVSVPKVGLSWRLNSALVAHATFSKSFRAPSPFEKSTTYSLFTTRVLDTGGRQTKILLVNAGTDPDVSPERSENYNFGLVFTPDQIGGLRLTLDAFRIKYSDRIAAPDPTFAFETDIRSTPAQLLNRNPTPGQLAALLNNANFVNQTAFPVSDAEVIVNVLDTNLASTEFQGLQVGASYQFDLAGSNFELSASALYIDKYTYQLLPTSPITDRVNTLFSPPDFRSRVGGLWTRGAISSSLYWNHTDGYSDTRVVAAPVRIKAWDTVDASLSYDFSGLGPRVTDGLRVIVSISNLFDTDPPYVRRASPSALPDWDAANASIVGRFVNLQLVKAF